jgi:hypothetical protein
VIARYTFAIVLLFFSGTSLAEVLATCGASHGHAYYVRGPFVEAKDSGWTEDKISKGTLQLIRSGDDYDVIFTDSTGGTLSAKGDGASTAGSFDDRGNLLLIVMYPGKSVETYVFWFAVKTEKTLTFSQAKYGAPIAKHSLLQATCEW